MRVSLPMMRVGIFLAAILLWANVQAFAFRTQTISIPLTVTNLPSGLALDTPLTHIQVSVSGRSFYLNRVTDQNLKLSVDLTNAVAGDHLIKPIKLTSTPNQVHILSWEPRQLDLGVDNIVSETKPVVLDTTGILADGFALENLTADPASVIVSGSPKLLAQISQVQGTVNIDHKRGTFSVPVDLHTELNGTTANLSLSPQSITAHATIDKGASMRNLGIKPVFTGKIPDGYFVREVNFDPPTMMVSGNQRVLAALANLESTPINLTNQRKTYSSDVAIDLPTGVKIVGDNLLKAEIVIELAQASRQFTLTPQFTNVTEGSGVTAINPKNIQLVVLGEESVLRKLTRDDIQFNLDLQGVLSGSSDIHITPGMFSLPPGVTVGSFTPDTLSVILSRP